MMPNSVPELSFETENEVALAARVAAGDDAAAHRFLQRALPRVRRTALFMCSEPMEQEDVIQNTLVELVKAAGSFRGESRFSWWVDRITVHMASRVIGKQVRRRRIREQTWFPAISQPSPEDEMDHLKMKQELSKIFEQIQLRDRTPLVLHHLYGYTVEEISVMTDAGVNTVRGRLRGGMKKMRRLVLRNKVLADWILVQ